MPSFILIHPTVWPQYTNVTERQTDRQTDRQRYDNIARTVLQTVAENGLLALQAARGVVCRLRLPTGETS